MTYEVYIRKDYKPVIREVHDTSIFRNRSINRVLVVVLCIATGLILGMRSHDKPVSITKNPPYQPSIHLISEPAEKNILTLVPAMESISTNEETEKEYSSIDTSNPFSTDEFVVENNNALTNQEMVVTVIPDNWDSLKVASGDNLSLIFDRLHIKPTVLHEIMSLGNDVAILKKLMPDHEMRYQFEDGELAGLQYEVNLTDTLHVTRDNGVFRAETITKELETRVTEATGVITDSLFMTAQRAGLSDNLTMQLVELYGWDIDFALEIRKGDRFYVVYEEKYKDGVKVQEGPILSAEFINQDKSYRTVRYTHADGYTDYYNENGFSMRKAFLRTPVKFTRISSGFSLGRKHPILNKIRAHRGVDYAAPTGTPIKATGDGVVTFAGNNGGYGRVVILNHGEKYSTLYGHMSKYANGVRTGSRVKQGQIIGYVGMTGLATGPHLHYEFRIHGVHHNPLTVKLPKAIGIPKDIMADFKEQTQPLLAQLDNVVSVANKEHTEDDSSVVALFEKDEIKTGSSE